MSSNSWVLITGANRATGLGYKTAKQLVNDGESVIIGARTQASGAALTSLVFPPLHPLPLMVRADGKVTALARGKIRNAI